MTPGGYVAIGGAAAFIGLAVYGLSFDIRMWWEDRGWKADERRAQKILALNTQPERQLDPDWPEYSLHIAEARRLRAFADQLDAIRALPTVEPWRRWCA